VFVGKLSWDDTNRKQFIRNKRWLHRTKLRKRELHRPSFFPSWTRNVCAQLALDHGHLRWTGQDDGKAVEFDHDPGASRWQRAKLRMLRLLPIEGLL